MSIESPGTLYAMAQLAYSPTPSPAVRYIRQDGFAALSRTGAGVYRLTLTDGLAAEDCAMEITGRDGYGVIATVVHTSDTIKTIYLFGADGAARDASIDVLVYRNPTTGQVDATPGTALSPPSAGDSPVVAGLELIAAGIVDTATGLGTQVGLENFVSGTAGACTVDVAGVAVDDEIIVVISALENTPLLAAVWNGGTGPQIEILLFTTDGNETPTDGVCSLSVFRATAP